MSSASSLGEPRPIRLFSVDDAEIKKLAADFSMKEQDLIRRLVALGLRSWRADNLNLHTLIPRTGDTAESGGVITRFPENPDERVVSGPGDEHQLMIVEKGAVPGEGAAAPGGKDAGPKPTKGEERKIDYKTIKGEKIPKGRSKKK